MASIFLKKIISINLVAQTINQKNIPSMMPNLKKASFWRGHILLTPNKTTIQKRANHRKFYLNFGA